MPTIAMVSSTTTVVLARRSDRAGPAAGENATNRSARSPPAIAVSAAATPASRTRCSGAGAPGRRWNGRQTATCRLGVASIRSISACQSATSSPSSASPKVRWSKTGVSMWMKSSALALRRAGAPCGRSAPSARAGSSPSRPAGGRRRTPRASRSGSPARPAQRPCSASPSDGRRRHRARSLGHRYASVHGRTSVGSRKQIVLSVGIDRCDAVPTDSSGFRPADAPRRRPRRRRRSRPSPRRRSPWSRRRRFPSPHRARPRSASRDR